MYSELNTESIEVMDAFLNQQIQLDEYVNLSITRKSDGYIVTASTGREPSTS